MTTGIILASSPCFSVTFHSNSETPGSHQLPTIYFIVQFSVSVRCTVVLELLSCVCAGNHFTSEGTMLMDNFSCFYSYRLCSPPELPRSAPYFPISSMSWSHRFVIQLDYFFTVCLSCWMPHPPRWLLKFAYIKIHPLCCNILWVW